MWLRSSPPARGTRSTSGAGTIYMPLIPSFKGNTSAPARDRWTGTAHPRMRGEQAGRLTVQIYPAHPRVRGKHKGATSLATRSVPLIPAREGNTVHERCSVMDRAAHSRMRGEYLISFSTARAVSRSSPHARGTRPRTCFGELCLPLIPACAGNTSIRDEKCIKPSAHPRMRGEHRFSPLSLFTPVRSSPHARGTHRDG